LFLGGLEGTCYGFSLVRLPALAILLSTAVLADPRGKLLSVRSAGDSATAAVELRGDRPLSFTTLKLSSPPRVVVDCADTSIGEVPRQIEVDDGTVRRIGVASAGARTARVVIELVADAEFDVRASGSRIEVRVTRAAPRVASASGAAGTRERAAVVAASEPEPPTVVAAPPPRSAAPPPPLAARTPAPPSAVVIAPDLGAGPSTADESVQRDAAAKREAVAAAEKRAEVAAAEKREEEAAAAKREAAAAAEKRAEVAAAEKREEEAAAAKREAAAAAEKRAEVAAAEKREEEAAAAKREAAAAAEKRAEVAAAKKRDEEATEAKREAASAAARRDAAAAAASAKLAEVAAAEKRDRDAAAEKRAEAAAAEKSEAAAAEKSEAAAAEKGEAPTAAPDADARKRASLPTVALQSSRGAPSEEPPAPVPAPARRAPPRTTGAFVPVRRSAPPRAQRRVAAAQPARKLITGVGFRPAQGGEVILHSDQPLEYGVSGEEGAIVIHLPRTAIPLPNNRRPLDTRFFDGPVQRIVPRAVAGGTDVRIELREHAEYQIKQDGTLLTVTFSTR
jgi:hypothetical protein